VWATPARGTHELFQRWFPEVPEQARAIKRSEARRELVSCYLDSVVAADRMIAKVFHMLKWTSREWDRTIAALVEKDVVHEIKIGEYNKPGFRISFARNPGSFSVSCSGRQPDQPLPQPRPNASIDIIRLPWWLPPPTKQPCSPKVKTPRKGFPPSACRTLAATSSI
jgi:hypothetical protein